jgi:hypothetical protein
VNNIQLFKSQIDILKSTQSTDAKYNNHTCVGCRHAAAKYNII